MSSAVSRAEYRALSRTFATGHCLPTSARPAPACASTTKAAEPTATTAATNPPESASAKAAAPSPPHVAKKHRQEKPRKKSRSTARSASASAKYSSQNGDHDKADDEEGEYTGPNIGSGGPLALGGRTWLIFESYARILRNYRSDASGNQCDSAGIISAA
jgi:hypothetical protein